MRLPRLNDRSIAPSTVALQIDQNTRVPQSGTIAGRPRAPAGTART
ncbi:hypothetical protein C7S13_4532 [Burkholderia cepacia]|nr:hypothetical protein [Burkholderia cepacia]